eukprot:scaffold1961_cov119-Isochrysis_galbana.AAC.1
MKRAVASMLASSLGLRWGRLGWDALAERRLGRLPAVGWTGRLLLRQSVLVLVRLGVGWSGEDALLW